MRSSDEIRVCKSNHDDLKGLLPECDYENNVQCISCNINIQSREFICSICQASWCASCSDFCTICDET